MRVLFAAPALPWPPESGGRIRTAALLGHAAREVELHLVCVAHPGVDPLAAEHLGRRAASVRISERTPAGPLEIGRRILRTRQEQWFGALERERALRGALAGGSFDLVHLDEPGLERGRERVSARYTWPRLARRLVERWTLAAERTLAGAPGAA